MSMFLVFCLQNTKQVIILAASQLEGGFFDCESRCEKKAKRSEEEVRRHFVVLPWVDVRVGKEQVWK